MNSELLSIIAYASMWCCAFLVYYKKKRTIDVPATMILTYSLTALTSIYFYLNPSFAAGREIFNVRFIPLVYLYVCILIWIRPFIIHGESLRNIKLSLTNNDTVTLGLSIVIIPFVLVCFAELVLLSIEANVISLSEAYADSDFSMSAQLSRVGRLGYTISHWGAYIWPIFFFMTLIKRKKYGFVFLLAYINEILQGYVSGDRVTLVRFFMFLTIVFVLMKNQMPDEMVRKIRRIGLITFSALVFILLFLTIARLYGMSSDYEMNSFLALYTGEGCIRFSQYIWDLKFFSNGDTNFALIKEFFGANTFTDLNLRRDFYESKMGIPTYIFYTFIGDFFQDFGKWGTLIFSVFMGWLTERVIVSSIKKSFCGFTKFFFICIIMQIIFFGFMYNNFDAYNDQLQLIAPLIFFPLLELFSKKRIQ